MKSNLCQTQEWLNSKHTKFKWNTFKDEDSAVYCIFSKIFPDTDSFIYIKQRKCSLDDQAIYYNVHKCFFVPPHGHADLGCGTEAFELPLEERVELE